ncbi:MAG TPA: ornithine cyclodeaminase family protein [Candidatus Limnocylindria bacterium]|nr:ornithine cyclodeaminase family protein [Candidatus Limnocylindria bacterium]
MTTPAETLVIDAATVRRLLPMDRCIDVMHEALSTLARGDAVNPLRSILGLPLEGTALALMPGAIKDPPAFGVKVISLYPHNREVGLETHQGVVLLFEAEHGQPVALVDASEVTALRTAAVSGAATRALARAEADDLAIIGSGTQARTHLDAMLAVRPVGRVRAWSPNRERLEAFVSAARGRTGLMVEAAADPRSAVDGASLVCTVSGAREPVIRGEWLAPGCHVNAVGSALPTARELDGAAVQRSRLFVDRRESALNEAGDIMLAMREGAIGEDHILAELGEVLIGKAPGRVSPQDVTLFKSLGLAIEDVATAHAVMLAARQAGAGTPIGLA